MGELVTIATTYNLVEAEFYKNQLEAAGFEVYLADDNIIGAFNLIANAVGGIKIRVPEEDAEDADAFLEELGEAEIVEGEMESADTGYGECEKCQSRDLSASRDAFGWKGIFVLIGIWIVKPKLRLTCNDCGFENIRA